MFSLLEQLPPEILSATAEYIDVVSLGSLRLVSKSCKEKFTPELLRHIETQKVDITESGLRRLCDLRFSEDLKRSIRKLHLVCLYYHQSPSRNDALSGIEITYAQDIYVVRKAGNDGSQLSRIIQQRERLWMADRKAQQEAFSGEAMYQLLYRALGNFDHLDTITLEAEVVCGPSERYGPESIGNLIWRRLWAQSIQAFRVVVSAVSRSKINLGSLAIFEKTKKCSIPVNEISDDLLDNLNAGGFTLVGATIRHFAISLATTVVPVRPSTTAIQPNSSFYEVFDISEGQKLTTHDTELRAMVDFEGTKRFLRFLPKLESLSIHLYNTTTKITTIPEELPFQAFLQYISQDWKLPHLRSLYLQGFPSTAETLQNILYRQQQLQRLSLENIFLTNGSWDLVMASAVQSCTLISQVYLSNLWLPGVSSTVTNLNYSTTTSDRLDVFNKTSTLNYFRIYPDQYILHTRDFNREDLIAVGEVGFCPTTSVAAGMSSWDVHAWYCIWLTEYGPI
ncbi:hypothetical protein BX600DRAFT_514166 [Xylariales sp. PMI_506]|nr:hypothetical protein BX600DRAFT_514166 [Xylariales sp. PMI_506]